MTVDNALVMILAGGEGKRLFPLTQDRAKPAVPFGGRYRIIDFVLNNFTHTNAIKDRDFHPTVKSDLCYSPLGNKLDLLG